MDLESGYGPGTPPARAVRVRLFALAFCALLSRNALAFNSDLQPQEVEEAYSLGQTSNHEELADFLNQYEHDFKPSTDNSVAFVSSVEFRTPYQQIVLRSLQTIHYSKFKAEEDYQANPGLVIVRVIVALKTGYVGPEPSADNFTVAVSQTKTIEPRKADSTVLCNPYNSLENPTVANCVAYTREIVLQFDAGQFAPGRATVKVTLPEGKWLETKFDLDKLK